MEDTLRSNIENSEEEDIVISSPEPKEFKSS